MTTRLIGIDFDGTTLRAVAVQNEKSGERLLQTVSFPWDGEAPLPPLLQGAGLIPAVGDRVTVALPPGVGLTRTLTFPFSDRRKIAHAIPLELAGLLPIPLDDCIIAQQDAKAAGGGVSVVAAAAPSNAVARVVGPFDSAGIPLQTVELYPFALAGGLADELGDGVSLCLSHGWGILLQLENGRLSDYRVLPLGDTLSPSGRFTELQQELSPFLRAAKSRTLRIFGAEVDASLVNAVQGAFPQIEVSAALPGSEAGAVTGEFLPALALARRGGKKGEGLNFRSGAFSRHGESDALRTRLWILAGIVLSALLIFAVSAGIRWWGKEQSADLLKKELTALYRQAIPGTAPVVDVTLQLRAHLAELTRKSRPGGQHPLLAPASVMREVVSRIPAEQKVTFREWGMTPGELRIEALAPSFETADKVAAALGASPLFRSVQVADAKNSADSSQVDFRLILTLRSAEELP